MPRVDTSTFYSAAVNKHGLTVQGLHWNSDANQQTRFKVLRSFLPETLGQCSVADAGCGFADLHAYLQNHAAFTGSYTGLEYMKTMCEEARRRSSGEIVHCDILHDPLPEADYYLCSGAMNILTRFETHLFIRRCFEAARKRFVFNLLEGRDASMVYNYFLPDEIVALGEELGAKKIEVKRGYLPRDFTVCLYKEEERD